MAIGWKMSSTEMLVMSAVAVGPIVPRVEVSTRDKVALLLNDTVGKGWAEGLPEVSSDVCAA